MQNDSTCHSEKGSALPLLEAMKLVKQARAYYINIDAVQRITSFVIAVILLEVCRVRTMMLHF